jgi:Na+/H+ antiporter NhaD/arsenite permease-like protein
MPLRPALRAVILLGGGLAVMSALASPAGAADSHVHAVGAGAPAAVPAPGWCVPFVLLLLAVAILPLTPGLSHWWEKNRNKLALGVGLGLVVLGYYGLRPAGPPGTLAGWPAVVAVLRKAVLHEFVPFIALLFSLYVIAGGLQLKGDLRARPAVNTAFLAIGAGLASLIGTTGASMVLIRPLLQTNRERTRTVHTVVFFIFLVSNVGGSLLPIGDPPLFLGYLQGVPFFWTLHLLRPWLFCVGALLAIYFVWDSLAYRREPAAAIALDEARRSPLRLHGGRNLLLLLGVVLAVAAIVPGRPLPGTSWTVPEFLREAILLGLAGASLATTPRGLRAETEFTYQAILEVAALFLGIFLTMQVPIEILQARGPELGLTGPRQFFWASGLLSSVLDNAPTYLVFFETARSLPAASGVPLLSLGGSAIRPDLLLAISMGSVFMGANTYIGNGPNFMVKSIAEHRGVRMPSFFGYMAYSVLVLLPLFAVASWLFL